MERFMLIVREDLKRIGRLTTEERFAEGPDMFGWIKSLAESGNYIGGEPLAVKGVALEPVPLSDAGSGPEAEEAAERQARR